jgi:SEC-C motif
MENISATGADTKRRPNRPYRWRLSWLANAKTPTAPAFEVTSKRRKSYPSETAVKRGERVVHGDVELTEKLGRNDLCPCGSGYRFQALLPALETL